MRDLPGISLLDHEIGSPIILVGEPTRMKGRIRLHNRAETRVVLRQANLCDLPTKHITKRTISSDQTISITAILEPNQKSQISLKVSIDQYTPPGNYHASLQIGEQHYPVELHVTENIAMDIAPGVVFVENRPGEHIRKQLILSNIGNVPLLIGNIGPVVIEEELQTCKTIRATLSENHDTAKTINQWVTAYLRQTKKQLDMTGLVVVDMEGAPYRLNPDKTISVNIRIRVPDTLDPRSRYQGVAYIYNTGVNFSVIPTGIIKEGTNSDDAKLGSIEPMDLLPG